MGRASRSKWEKRAVRAEDPHEKNDKLGRLGLIVAVVSAGVAVVGVLVAIVAIFVSHHDATNDPAKRLEQRAWIASLGPASMFNGEPCRVFIDEHCRVFAQYKNVGMTTALDAKGKVILRIQPLNSPEPKFDAENFQGSFPISIAHEQVITQDEDVSEFLNAMRPSLPAGDALALLRNNSHRLYAYGGMTYTDIFHEGHWITYCFYLKPDVSTWKSCSLGNQEDQTRKEK